MNLLGGLGGLCLWGCLLPCLGLFVGLLVWPAWVLEGLGGPLSSGEGRRAVGWEGRGVRGVLTWERLASSRGGIGVAPAWGRAPPSLAWLLAREALASPWGGPAWEDLLSSLGGCLGDYLPVNLGIVIVIVIMIIIIWISIRPCYISFLSGG